MKNSTIGNLIDDEEYRDAFDRLQELRLRAGEVERAIEEALAGSPGTSRKERIGARAAALVGAGDAPPEEPGVSSEELAELQEERSVLAEAVRLQEAAVKKLASQKSREIVERVRPEYEKLIERLAGALVELGKVADEEAEFRTRLDEAGVKYGPYLTPPFAIGRFRLGDRESKLRYWLRAIEREYGVKARR